MGLQNMATASTNWQVVQRRHKQPSNNETLASHWLPGDIAFLKSQVDFTQVERAQLLDNGHLPPRATGHPVIILDRSNNSLDFLVTTVSAYSSSSYNNYLPPWQQDAHKRKNINGFRAFQGSARPNDNFPHLRLQGNKVWPKPETSWVYIHQSFIVPASTLINYTKSRCQLQMAPESLKDLVSHMESKSRIFRDQQTKLHWKIQPQFSQLRERNKENFQSRNNNRSPWESTGKTLPCPLLDITNKTAAKGAISNPTWSSIAAY
ncbi:hypothetical protein GGS21DRAFT_255947 [Xylaria nigripes]|nr:hypothetical protein GGS21DRAFT_255947 [Xylaria nigripes]